MAIVKANKRRYLERNKPLKSKRILITGLNSYIGTNVMRWLNQTSTSYEVTRISLRDPAWKSTDFDSFDVVLHAAGIAHVTASSNMADEYFRVNRDLSIEVAKYAKRGGVQHFVFLSSIIVYGRDRNIGDYKLITAQTVPEPSDFYGKSKLEAEDGLKQLEDQQFKVALIRTPMVYGPESKGNFQRLKKLVSITPLFPDIQNVRSMIYIDNLCEFIRLIIDHQLNGTFFPQNKEHVSVKEMVHLMARYMGKNIAFTKAFNPLLRGLSGKVAAINKLFGNKAYDLSMSMDLDYRVVDFEESIKRSL